MNRLWAPWRHTYITNVDTDRDQCVFCTISAASADKDRELLVLYRSEGVLVVLNKYPYNNGHLLIVPHAHVPTLGEVAQPIRAEVMELMHEAVGALSAVSAPQGFNLGANLGRIAGAGIDQHIHFHVVPRYMGDTNFIPVVGETKVISQSLEATWESLRPEFDAMAGGGAG